LVSLYKLPQDYQLFSIVPKLGTVFANRYFRFSEIGTEIEIRVSFDAPGLVADILCKRRCIQLAGEIENYLSAVGDAYDDNPGKRVSCS
jgi:hypothetical protein